MVVTVVVAGAIDGFSHTLASKAPIWTKSGGRVLMGRADSNAPTIDDKAAAFMLLAWKAVSQFVVLIELVWF